MGEDVDMRLDEACANSFARHETFHPRWGWIRKAYVATADSSVFNAEDATLRLGVGKNMVRAIRFWGHAFRALAYERDEKRPRMSLSVQSQIGRAIFDEDTGWDPFTEDPGTLWLLHWLLLAPIECAMPVWWTAFNEFGAVEFTQQELSDFVTDQVGSVSSWSSRPHPSSIDKDVSWFRFVVGPKPTLPPEIVFYACADFLARTESGANTVSVSRLATEAGAPGRVFKVSEADLVELLEEAVRDVPHASLARPAGAVQLALADDPALLATSAAREYYRRRGLGSGPDARLLAGPMADRPFREVVRS